MRLVAPLLVAVVLVALCCLAELARQHNHYRALAARYAGAISECANGKSFLVGRRIVMCEVTDTGL